MNSEPQTTHAVESRSHKQGVRELIATIRRPPAKKIAFALLKEFPDDLEVQVIEKGWAAAVGAFGQAMVLCETYDEERDGRTGWWTMTESMTDQIIAFFRRAQAQAAEKEAPPSPILVPKQETKLIIPGQR